MFGDTTWSTSAGFATTCCKERVEMSGRKRRWKVLTSIGWHAWHTRSRNSQEWLPWQCPLWPRPLWVACAAVAVGGDGED